MITTLLSLLLSLSYGVVLRELQMVAEARQMFLRSVHLTPLLWAAWQELAKLCEDRDMVGG